MRIWSALGSAGSKGWSGHRPTRDALLPAWGSKPILRQRHLLPAGEPALSVLILGISKIRWTRSKWKYERDLGCEHSQHSKTTDHQSSTACANLSGYVRYFKYLYIIVNTVGRILSTVIVETSVGAGNFNFSVEVQRKAAKIKYILWLSSKILEILSVSEILWLSSKILKYLDHTTSTIGLVLLMRQNSVKIQNQNNSGFYTVYSIIISL